MFPSAYFAPAYFAPRYWERPPVVIIVTGGGGGKARKRHDPVHDLVFRLLGRAVADELLDAESLARIQRDDEEVLTLL